MLKGTVEDLLENVLEVNVNVSSTSESIIVIVKKVDGVPTSYSYEITEPDDYSKSVKDIDKNTYTFDKLKIDTEYTIKVTVKNRAGLTREITKTIKTEKIENPSISITHSPSNASLTTTNGYSKEEVASVVFSDKNITNPIYYIKSTLKGTTSVNVLGSCTEENSKPKTCTNIDTNKIEANTWYKVSGNINVTYNTETNSNQTIYAITFDGTNYSDSATGTTLKIDNVGPIFKTTVNENIVTITNVNDTGIGLHTTSAYSCDGKWQETGTCQFKIIGKHEINVRDALGNEGKVEITNGIPTIGHVGVKAIVFYDPVTDKLCNKEEAISLTETKTGCMKWYAYEETDDTYTMILDHNTTGAIAWNSNNDNTDNSEIIEQLKKDTSTWKNEARLIEADEVAKIVNRENWTSKVYSGTFFFEDLTTDETATKECAAAGNCKYAWIYDRTSNACKDIWGCLNSIEENYGIVGYWTGTTAVGGDPSLVWKIHHYGRMNRQSANKNSGYGIRPVITISKSIINN